MRLFVCIGTLAAVVAGCHAGFGDPSPRPDGGVDAGPGLVPVPACPVDPDCGSTGDCECPDYWECEDLPDARVRCTNPGPDLPDGGVWECHDEGGRTVCRSDHFPDGGGGGGWTCEMVAEFVVCTNDMPAYPDDGSGGTWSCWFMGEFRVCESGPGDGGGWTCYDTPTGRECRHRDPDFPDDREWDCYDLDGETVCQATGDLPDGGGGGAWSCEMAAEFVVCRRGSSEYPDDGGGGTWYCEYVAEFRVCRRDFPDGGDDTCAGTVQRWCDDAIYCSWGRQQCRPDGRWGPCIEPTVTREGLSDRPATACGCRYFHFNYDCCEDQADTNADGHADCIIPADHVPPACTTDGTPCSYCDSHLDCGGAPDLCVFMTDGYAFCGRECTDDASCGSGYRCQAIGLSTGTTHQCVPTAGTCG